MWPGALQQAATTHHEASGVLVAGEMPLPTSQAQAGKLASLMTQASRT